MDEDDLIAREWLIKSCSLIVSARETSGAAKTTAAMTTTTTTIAPWFNFLGCNEIEEKQIRKTLEPIWGKIGFNQTRTPVVVDIHHKLTTKKEEDGTRDSNKLVERWFFSIDPNNAREHSNEKRNSEEIYKDLNIQMRVLTSLLRALLAYKLSRRARLALRADAGEIFHKIYAMPQAFFGNEKPKVGMWNIFEFSKTQTMIGSLNAKCYFLD